MRYAVAWGLGLTLVAAAGGQPPDRWVTITGRVVLPAGVPLPPEPAQLAGRGGMIPDERVLVHPKTRGVRNVLVWLRPDDKNPKSQLVPEEIHPSDAKRRAAVVELSFTPKLVFEPRLATARAGDTLTVHNRAAQNTAVYWSGDPGNPPMNMHLLPGQKALLAAPLIADRVPSDYLASVVPARGYLRVFEHPYYAVTDADGRFELANAPAGKYRLVYWHERVGYRGGREWRFGEAVEVAGKAGRMALPAVEFDVTK